jgi:hypothetical protein
MTRDVALHIRLGRGKYVTRDPAPAADVALLNRAIDRSGLSLREFARRELVRDERTLRAYRRGAPMPDVVREKVAQLARRRRSVKL